MNAEVIERVNLLKDDVLQKMSNRDIVSFQLRDLDFGSNINIAGSILSRRALNKILASFRVRNTFFKYEKDLTEDNWNTIKNILKNANQNIEFWGRRWNDGQGFSTITELYQRNLEIGTATDLNSNFNTYFDMVIEALENSDIAFDWKSGEFDIEKEMVNIIMITTDSEIDIFRNNVDLWKTGVNLNWDLLKFSDAPFFERLICTNGMVSQNQGFRANIQNKKFNLDKIEKEIKNIIMKPHAKFEDSLQMASAHLRDNNVSLKEFYDFRDFFVSKNKDKVYDHILDKVFNETDIFRNYAVNILEKSEKWLSTADSGRNAYDFINDMTYIGSHSDEVNINPNDAKELQIKAGDLFFKSKLDLEDVAPGMKFNVNKVFKD